MTLTKLILTTVVFFTSTFAFSQSSKNNKMNLKELHKDSIGVQTNVLFPATEGKVISLQILKGNTLKEHLSKVPALLVCVTGNTIYEDEKGIKVTLKSGDFIKIEPNVKHWRNGIKDSNLLLIK